MVIKVIVILFLFQMFSDNQNFNNGHPDNMHPFVNNNDIISKYNTGNIVSSELCCKKERKKER